MPLSQAKIELVERVFASAPDEALRRLESLLTTARRADPTLEPVLAIAAAETMARRIVAEVFEPLSPLTYPAAPPKRPLIGRGQLSKAWRAAAFADPDFAERTARAVRAPRDDEAPVPVEYNQACARAAEAVAEKDPDLARFLRLTPVLRSVQHRLLSWAHNLTGERIASVRLAFKDALAVDEDAGPAFWEAIFAMLDEPWKIIRLISAAIDRPGDRFLAASELAPICERLLDDIDGRVAGVKRFDPNQGDLAGATLAASILIAVQEIGEFEEWLALKKDGPWGQRITEQKRGLALGMEARLRETEPAVAAALPTQAGRGAGRSVRPSPKLSSDPEPLLVARADALLTLIEESRGAAGAGGFGALRTKTMESLEKRLEQYCDDLLDLLHRGDVEDTDRIRAYLEIAARFVGLVQGPQNAQIVRRRAAAA